MSTNTLEIILEAKDQATAEIQKVNAELKSIERATIDVGKRTEETGKTIKQQFKEASAELRDFRKTMFLVTAALAVMVGTTREAAKYSTEAQQKYKLFTTSLSGLASTAGSVLAPALAMIGHVINAITTAFEFMVASMIKGFTLIVEGAVALFNGMKNVFENLKSFFTGQGDPMGIVEGFGKSFERALQVADIATDQFIVKTEEMRARITAGQTSEKIAANTKKLAEENKKTAVTVKEVWEGTGSALGQLDASLQNAAQSNKKFAGAAKATSIGMAIVNTAEGITKQYATYPFPIASVFAAMIAAAGAIQIATISSTPLAKGGIVTGPTQALIGEAGPEAVIPLSQYGGRLGGFGQTVNIEINYPSIRNDQDIDTLTEEISRRLARETERL